MKKKTADDNRLREQSDLGPYCLQKRPPKYMILVENFQGFILN